MKIYPLYVPFILALLAQIIIPALFPVLHLSIFAPFLAIAYHRTSFIKSLWIAFGCGILLDLLNPYTHFGIFGFDFVLTTIVLYSQKKHFFEEKPIALSLFTFLIATISSLFLLILIQMFEQGLAWSWKLICVDIFLYSAFDAFYAFLWFTLPLKLYPRVFKM